MTRVNRSRAERTARGDGRSFSADDFRSADEGFTQFDVVIIGSGPAGVAIAERLYERTSEVSIAVIERGPLLLRRHFYDSGSPISARDDFLAAHRDNQWEGDLTPGGGLLPCVGGRGIVGGSQLHRYYDDDFSLWRNGVWPAGATDLKCYYREAEARLLGPTRSVGSAQDFAYSALGDLGARHPPHGVGDQVAGSPDAGFPHRSSAERLLALLGADRLASHQRLRLFTNLCAVELGEDRQQTGTVSRVRCVSIEGSPTVPRSIFGKFFVLAASPVESARLALTSRLGDAQSNNSTVGRYLAEHVYCRGIIDVPQNSDLAIGPVNLFVPPSARQLEQRYQIELRSVATRGGESVLRVTGSAAMDPDAANRVEIVADKTDSYGRPCVRTTLQHSESDKRRVTRMLDSMSEVAGRLGGEWIVSPSVLAKGASFHESGTLRMAEDATFGAVDVDGKLHGSTNVFVGDGSAFPCVGVANPILTLTALGYRLGEKLALVLNDSNTKRASSAQAFDDGTEPT